MNNPGCDFDPNQYPRLYRGDVVWRELDEKLKKVTITNSYYRCDGKDLTHPINEIGYQTTDCYPDDGGYINDDVNGIFLNQIVGEIRLEEIKKNRTDHLTSFGKLLRFVKWHFNLLCYHLGSFGRTNYITNWEATECYSGQIIIHRDGESEQSDDLYDTWVTDYRTREQANDTNNEN